MGMMHNGFTQMISALWQGIGLGDPLWTDEGAALLHLDNLTVEMTLSEDGGFVLASVDIARLSEDQSRKRTETDALLKFSLLNLTASRGAISIEDREEATIAVARGLCPCQIGLTHRLSDVLVDVVQVRDECLKILEQAGLFGRPSSDLAPIAVADGSLIFTP
jgi:hypothetical protein